MNYEELYLAISGFLSEIKKEKPKTELETMTAVLHTLTRQYETVERLKIVQMATSERQNNE